MPNYFVTGKLGAGKTLGAVYQIREYLSRGLPVATNLDLSLEEMVNPWAKQCRVTRLPDKPSVDDLNALGNANETYDEMNNGALVLDECASWFHAQDYRDPEQRKINDWCRHARKLGWDVYFIVQDLEIISKEVRRSLLEHLVVCKRMDRIAVPFASKIYKLFMGKPLTFPKWHFCKVYYGESTRASVSDVWRFAGAPLYKAYDTKQVFMNPINDVSLNPSPVTLVQANFQYHTVFTTNSCGIRTCLSPYYTYGRYHKLVTRKEKLINLMVLYLSGLIYSCAFVLSLRSDKTVMQLLSKWDLLKDNAVQDIPIRYEITSDKAFNNWMSEHDCNEYWLAYHENGHYQQITYTRYLRNLYVNYQLIPESVNPTFLLN